MPCKRSLSLIYLIPVNLLFMKKIFLFSFAAFLFKVSSGQVSKGNMLLGGDFTFTHSGPNKATVGITGGNNIESDVNAGYFLIDKLAAGVRTGIHTSRYKVHEVDNSTYVLSQSSFGFGPFLRYYMHPSERMVNFFGDAGFLYNFNSRNGDWFITRSLSSSVAAGAVVFLNKSVGLEGLLSYTHSANINTDLNSSSLLQFKVGLQVHLKKKSGETER
jgi:hypothetical protein